MIGSTATVPAPAKQHATDSQRTAEQLALLTARTGLEPELAQRYLSNPVSVLAEFGLAAEPVYLEMTGSRPTDLRLEVLDGAAAGGSAFCDFTHGPSAAPSMCNFTHGPATTTSMCNFTHSPATAASMCHFTHSPAASASFCNFTHGPAAAELS
ncbi:hypothetical protein ACFWBR_31420 [Streptomyces sp. NPDC060006]|uniref:hypothetical protein n=1 Tax=unclassified Streptomyces TaxID=2593676 RepID=UPI0036C6D120